MLLKSSYYKKILARRVAGSCKENNMKIGIATVAGLCLVGAAAASAEPGAEVSNSYQSVLEEVIVTAQKRGDEKLLDVAMSISALSSDEIAKRNLKGMNDYLRYEPGTNFIDRGTGRNSAIIRGISSDPGRGGAITGIYIDEIPLQGLDIYDTGSPDLGLVDVERVEVLRGPQGTLYGAGSMSGTVRTLTRAPELDAFGGYAKAGGSVTSGYGNDNNEIEAVVNIPVVDKRFALRVVGYRFDRSGYIKNVGNQDPAKLAAVDLFNARVSDRAGDRGALKTKGFRLGALWRVTDRLDIRFTAIGQQNDQDGIPTIDPLQGSYEQSRFTRLDGSDESMSDDLGIYALTATYTAKNWSLLSATAWTDYRADINWDVGIFFLDYLDGIETPMWIHQATDNELLTEELRWTWDAGGRWRFLLGAFYEHRKGFWIDSNHTEGYPDPYGGFFELPEDHHSFNEKRKSVFGDATFGLTQSLELTGGYRRYRMADRDSGDTWKAGLNWRPQTDLLGEEALVYALWGEGFRPGFQVGDPPSRCDQNNDGIIDVIGLPWNNVISDKLKSLEFGYKASFARRRLSVEAAVFDIDWTGLRVDVVVGSPCGYTLPFNAGAAKSKGLEFEVSALLTDRLKLDVAGSWVNAELSGDSSLGSAGSRLPGSPQFNISLALEYGFELAGHSAWLRCDAAYVGDYYNTLAETAPRLGDYATVDLGAGVDLARWSLELYVKNLTDSDALTWANPIFAPYDRQSRLRPRTIGARLGYRFGKQ